LERAAQPRSQGDTAGDLPELRRLLQAGRLRWEGEVVGVNLAGLVVKDHDSRSGLSVVPTEGVHSGPVRCAAWAVATGQRLLGAALSA
jgi:hypothetical protein